MAEETPYAEMRQCGVPVLQASVSLFVEGSSEGGLDFQLFSFRIFLMPPAWVTVTSMSFFSSICALKDGVGDTGILRQALGSLP